ncbi:MAG: acylphosphatase [Candidatus Nanoarchaeia archaeon]|nr:acylphosphatase [Candidatus Nanoarchaeia archaeon]
MKTHVLITGKVIMVGFRFFIKLNAKKLHLNGFVKNRSDGKLEALFIGEKEDIDKMLEKCKEGPLFAKVKEIVIIDDDISFDKDDFEIRF